MHLEHPFAGSRMLRDLLRQDGIASVETVTTLMRRMGIEALYERPRTTSRVRGIRCFRTCCAT